MPSEGQNTLESTKAPKLFYQPQPQPKWNLNLEWSLNLNTNIKLNNLPTNRSTSKTLKTEIYTNSRLIK